MHDGSFRLHKIDLAFERDALLDRLTERGILRDARVRDALRRVRRHMFLEPEARRYAYEDAPLGIGHGQTISAPHMVAMMLQPARLQPGEQVLEVGGGSGYLAAVAAELVRPSGHVTTMEIVPDLARGSRRVLDAEGYAADQVEVIEGDGSLGHPPSAPYDAIFVSAAAPRVPPPLVAQLSPERGRLVIPIGERDHQTLCLVRPRAGSEGSDVEALEPCRFVPLRGVHGW